MMNSPSVDIVIPVYNVADYLDDCITSVVGQTYSNMHIILIDDGSTDNSGEICERYAEADSRIEVIHQENGGLSSARNTGISRSTGDYITFIDSDDVVLKTYVEHLVCAAELAGCDVAIGGFDKFLDGEDWKLPAQRSSSMGYAVLDRVEALNVLHDGAMGCSFTAWGKLYKQALFDGDDMRFPVGRLHEDDFLTHRLVIAANKVVFSGTYDYRYRVRKTGIMGGRSQRSYRDAVDARISRFAAYLKLGDAGLSAIGLHDVVISCMQYWQYLNHGSSDGVSKNELLSLCRSVVKEAPRSLLNGRPRLRLLCLFPYAPALLSSLIKYRGDENY